MQAGAEMIVPHLVHTVGATLGEGPIWVDDALWFVDIKKHHIHRYTAANDRLATWNAPAQPGWILPHSDGGWLVGLQSGLHRFDPDRGAFHLIAPVEEDRPTNRLNDATVDPAGRLWFGSMDDAEEQPSGVVYRADRSGVSRVLDGICIPNGPAITPDGRTLYHVDTLGGRIAAYTIDAAGNLVDQRDFARIDPADGYPDGPVVDAEGCLWVGLFGGWGVRRYDPAGALMTSVRFPVANVTKIALTPDGTAYATTAAKGLDDDARAAQPLAGDLFAFRAGVAAQRFQPISAYPA
jgi:D-xylonolactonase